ncbi:hypothetical protein, partial [Novosphingobium sp.]|uniref:hypothetical protein n=1 Tax=Novosphingobium sp. TaxID=1874826 RepID=UPI00286D8D1E
GFLCAFVTLDGADLGEARATGGKPASIRAVLIYVGCPRLLFNEQIGQLIAAGGRFWAEALPPIDELAGAGRYI